MILDSTTKKIQILLGAVKTTIDCPVIVDYVDMTSSDTSIGTQLSNTNGTSVVDICNAPAASTQRKINYISLSNKDSDWIIVTIRLNDNSTLYNYVNSIQIAPNSTLQYTDYRGWVTIDQGGNTVVTSGSLVDIQTFTANGVWTKPTSATYCLIDVCAAGSGGGGGGSVASGAVFGGSGGGAGKRVKNIFLAKYLPNSASVTVAAKTGNASAASSGLFGSYSYMTNVLYAYSGGIGDYSTVALQGGGGGGPLTSGNNSSTGNVTGGSAYIRPTGDTPTDAGGGCSAGISGGNSYLGGGGGGSTYSSAVGGNGGSSFLSSGGGGGGGSTDGATDRAGGAGGNAGPAATVRGGGGTAGTAGGGNGGNGADGDSTKSGQGGGGGGSNFAGTGGNGGDGGAPGGGGGGGGGGLTGGKGGAGARGEVTIISW